MEVKIYREPENENLILDENQLLEYNSLVAELGLNNQVQDPSENKVPNVYVCLNTAMQKQLQALCPSRQSVEDYKRTTIPVEVLKVYKFAKEENMFDSFEIWYDDKTPDPLFIGVKWQSDEAKRKNYSWLKDRYLIARWGDCAMEIPELLELGTERIKKELVSKANLLLSKVEGVLKNPDSYVDNILAGGNELNGFNLSMDVNGNIF